MFYNSGTIFQTTFEQNINIPKLGENLVALLHHVRLVYEISQFKIDNYKKLIFETDDISVIILKLGEDSNIALFFKKEEEEDLKLSSIKRYITRIEALIDMNEEEIILQEILTKEEELKNALNLLQFKQENIQNLHEKLKILNEIEYPEESKQIEKEVNSLNEDCAKIDKEISDIQEEILRLKQDIEK